MKIERDKLAGSHMMGEFLRAVVPCVLVMLAVSAFGSSKSFSIPKNYSGQETVSSSHNGNDMHTYSIAVPSGKRAKISLRWTGASEPMYCDYTFLFRASPWESVYGTFVGSEMSEGIAREWTVVADTVVFITLSSTPRQQMQPIYSTNPLTGQPYLVGYRPVPYSAWYCDSTYAITVTYEDDLPDIDITGVTLIPGEIVAEDEYVSVDVWIRNNGTRSAGSFVVGAFENGVEIGAVEVSGIDTDSAKIITIPMGRLSLGAHTVEVKVDTGDNVAELSEKNNTQTVSIVIVGETNYNVRFDPNGGIGYMSDQAFRCGTVQPIDPCSFVRDGYIFKGWARTRDGAIAYKDEEEVENLTDEENGTVVLYAMWEEVKTCRIVYHTFDGYGSMPDQILTNGILSTLHPSRIKRDGYEFVGWARSGIMYGNEVSWKSYFIPDCANFRATQEANGEWCYRCVNTDYLVAQREYGAACTISSGQLDLYPVWAVRVSSSHSELEFFTDPRFPWSEASTPTGYLLSASSERSFRSSSDSAATTSWILVRARGPGRLYFNQGLSTGPSGGDIRYTVDGLVWDNPSICPYVLSNYQCYWTGRKVMNFGPGDHIAMWVFSKREASSVQYTGCYNCAWLSDTEWKKCCYRIGYELDGGSYGISHPTNVEYDVSVRVSAPTRIGYVFSGWTVTGDVVSAVARWGQTSTMCDEVCRAQKKYDNGPGGDLYFKNLTTKFEGNVILTANWTAAPVVSAGVALDNDLLAFSTGGTAGWFGQKEISHDGVDAMQSGTLEPGQDSWIQTTVSGPGEISFWWWTSQAEEGSPSYNLQKIIASAMNWGETECLTFSVDGMSVGQAIAIACPGKQFTYAIGAGTHTLKWNFHKPDDSFWNSAWLDQVTWRPTERYVVSYKEGFFGTGFEECDSKTKGEALILREAFFSRIGYTQTDWSQNADGSTKDYELGASYTTDAAITLYPYWTANTYSVAYSLGDGGAHGSTHPTSATYDTAFSVSAPSRAGYTFVGWTVTSGLNTSTAKWGTSSSPATAISSTSTKCVNGATGAVYFKNLTATANGSVMLTANWILPSGCYAVQFVADEGAGTITPAIVRAGTVFALPPCTFAPPVGKRFVGWACSNGRRYDDGMLVFNLAQPGETVTMTAIWE